MSDNLIHRSTTACLVAAPTAWLASAIISPGERSEAADQLNVIAQHSTRWTTAAVLLIVGTILFVPGLAALAPIALRRTPKLGLVAIALLGYGLIVSIGDCFGQLVLGVLAHEADRASMLDLADRLESNASSSALYATGGLAFTLGAIVLGVALARSGAVPPWAAALVGVSFVANIVGWSIASQPVVALSCVPLLGGLLVVARRAPAGFTLMSASPHTSSA